MASPPEAEAARGSLLRRVVRYPFLPGMAAAFADYLGMALITPALPYFLEEELGMSTRDSSLWTGAITTAQYAGGAVGNTFVGVLGDRLGSRFTLASTLGGDVVFFAATAFARSVALILSFRFLAGVASPLVPSLMYILERATEEGASKLAGVNAYSASVNFAYAFGGMIVGLFYYDMGWTGLNLFSAAVAALALVVVRELAAENNDNGRGDGVGVILGDGEEKQERGGDAEVVSAAAVSAAAAAAEPLGGPPPNPNPNQVRLQYTQVFHPSPGFNTI
jgi:MFS family permease